MPHDTDARPDRDREVHADTTPDETDDPSAVDARDNTPTDLTRDRPPADGMSPEGDAGTLEDRAIDSGISRSGDLDRDTSRNPAGVTGGTSTDRTNPTAASGDNHPAHSIDPDQLATVDDQTGQTHHAADDASTAAHDHSAAGSVTEGASTAGDHSTAGDAADGIATADDAAGGRGIAADGRGAASDAAGDHGTASDAAGDHGTAGDAADGRSTAGDAPGSRGSAGDADDLDDLSDTGITADSTAVDRRISDEHTADAPTDRTTDHTRDAQVSGEYAAANRTPDTADAYATHEHGTDVHAGDVYSTDDHTTGTYATDQHATDDRTTLEDLAGPDQPGATTDNRTTSDGAAGDGTAGHGAADNGVAGDGAATSAVASTATPHSTDYNDPIPTGGETTPGDAERFGATPDQPILADGATTPGDDGGTTGGPSTPDAVAVASADGAATEPPERLWPAGAVDELRSRWDTVQLRFVDDPASVAADARQLVAETIRSLQSALSERERQLEEWATDSNDTEELRQLVSRYRRLFETLIS